MRARQAAWQHATRELFRLSNTRSIVEVLLLAPSSISISDMAPMMRVALAMLLGLANGLKVAPATRRSIVSSGAALALSAVPLASFAAKEEKVGYKTSVSDSAVAQLTATPGQGEAAGIRFGGTYSDAASGLTRKIVLAGSNVIITDPATKGWKVKGKFAGKKMLIDFTPTGGEELIATYKTGVGLVFPDGNVWKKM